MVHVRNELASMVPLLSAFRTRLVLVDRSRKFLRFRSIGWAPGLPTDGGRSTGRQGHARLRWIFLRCWQGCEQTGRESKRQSGTTSKKPERSGAKQSIFLGGRGRHSILASLIQQDI